MRHRAPRRAPREEKELTGALSMLMAALFMTMIIMSVITALRYQSIFHIPVIGASMTLFGLAVAIRIKGTRANFAMFFCSAIAVNIAMVYIAGGERDSWRFAAAAVFLFTGLIGILLLSRTERKPSRIAKAAIMAAALFMALAGPVLYFMDPEVGIMREVMQWLLIVVSIPMIFIIYMLFITLNSYHDSEVTLPSDKWV